MEQLKYGMLMKEFVRKHYEKININLITKVKSLLVLNDSHIASKF
jgi:hypothetical protein